MLTTTLFRSIAACEISAWQDMYKAAGKDISEEFGIKVFSIGSASISIAKQIDILAYNRVIGLGLFEPATEQILDEIISKYKDESVKRFFIQIHPEASPSQLKEWFEKRNIHHHNNWIKHYRGIENPPTVETNLDIREVSNKSEAEKFGEIIAKSFKWPDEMKNWFANIAGRKCWKAYLAYDGNTPVATASLYVKDDCGWLSFASTLSDYRGRGAQSAMIAKRIQDAAELGCKVLTVETAEETEEKRSQSLQNIQKMGFEVAFIRPNFIWKKHNPTLTNPE
jgi:GNAT superfamily N-acetyltransferase